MVDLLKEYRSTTPTNNNLSDDAKKYIKQSSSDNTRKTRQNAIRSLEKHGYSLPMTPVDVSNYLTDLAKEGKAYETIRSYKTTIRLVHKSTENEDPTDNEIVRRTLRGISVAHGTRQAKADPLTANLIRTILDVTPKDTKKGIRDRTLISLGFSGAFRRAELAPLKVSDIQFVDEGMIVNIRNSKTNQTGAEESKAIPYAKNKEYCPVLHMKTWLHVSGISGGSIFLSFARNDKIKQKQIRPEQINKILKEYAKKANLEVKRISGHSLRSGMITEATMQGKMRHKIKEMSNHTSDQVFDGYIRDKHRFLHNASDGLL